MSDIRSIVAKLAQELGMNLLAKRDGEPETLFHFRMPAMRAWVDLDEQFLAMPNARAMFDLLHRELFGVQRNLFRLAIDHIAKHDREPLDRVVKLEAAARALLEAIGPVGWGDSLISKAVSDLESLLRAKPGAASFARHGYGKDPPT